MHEKCHEKVKFDNSGVATQTSRSLAVGNNRPNHIRVPSHTHNSRDYSAAIHDVQGEPGRIAQEPGDSLGRPTDNLAESDEESDAEPPILGAVYLEIDGSTGERKDVATPRIKIVYVC